VGGIGGFGDPGKALAEMARVARPGTPIVVVDEQLDQTRHNSLYHRLGFRMLTFYDRDPKAPTDQLPPGATAVLEEPVSRFYYCLSFRMD
jgi:ubiquinone/menaquinone biosynthesis C-methylase UbiE